MATGKSVNLRVRPVMSADLSFPVDGVISRQSPVMLGSRVEGLDVEVLYAMLGQTVEGDSSRLLWDSKRIFSYLFNVAGQAAGHGVTLLSRLRSASEAADLDRAVMMRQNAYLTSYSPEVLSEVRRVYYEDPSDEWAVRHRLLKAVEDDAGLIHHGLTDAYRRRGWSNKVIEETTSISDNKATQYSGAGNIQFEGFTDTKSGGYEFRHPSGENDLRYHQSRAAVRQEFLNAWRMSEMCRYGDTTFSNEIGAIDRSIRKLQSAYIDTFLFTPTGGIVTGVFHGQGDYVRAGEPVFRVEDDGTVYLVGTVKYRGMLRIGTMLEVSTTLFEAAGAAPITVAGEIVAVRGHDSVSEQWDLLMICDNRTAAGDVILPLNYNFDFESTSVEVTAP
ncbi:HlyD family efflux transporter periplasmic adaptor subunit [Micromonospora sp. NPDC023966]|uniref:HlyD family efflux transporter periplasmic adaptor subunit n=1 Tax=Micromonospora sp. NPDC023966 TaxID=3154699 RepID=UPI0033EDFE57